MAKDNVRPPYDTLLQKIADYIVDYKEPSEIAWDTARYCLSDALGCAILALEFEACKKLLGPWVDGIQIQNGARVPGTPYELDPVKAAFDLGTMIRWLDYNDTWLAKEWGHPSDNIGCLLTLMDFVSRRKIYNKTFTVADLLLAMIKAYEIQGMLAIENSFNQVGLDHVVLVKVASVGLCVQILGGNKAQIIAALSQAWVDGQSLRTYRHAPNTGTRKSWAAGDAVSRAVRLSLLTLQGEQGYPSALTAKTWGFQDVLFKDHTVSLEAALGSYVMENILFKIAYPAEFHAQTAVECAFKLHSDVKERLNHIKQITIHTHASALRIIDKKGPLYNPADRDHCMQYMVAVALMKGTLAAEDYEDEFAKNPLVDELRNKMQLVEDKQFSEDYLDPQKRSISNRLLVEMNTGAQFEAVCEYPLGHARRRHEGIPLMWQKFEKNLKRKFSEQKMSSLKALMENKSALLKMPIPEFVSQWLP